MGFFDFLKGAGKAVLDTQKEALKYADRYRNLSKEDLERKFKNSSSIAEKMGITRVMKEKGYR